MLLLLNLVLMLATVCLYSIGRMVSVNYHYFISHVAAIKGEGLIRLAIQNNGNRKIELLN